MGKKKIKAERNARDPTKTRDDKPAKLQYWVKAKASIEDPVLEEELTAA